jgi:hypothetical protein
MEDDACVRGGPNQPLHRDLQWSIVLKMMHYPDIHQKSQKKKKHKNL